MLGFHPCLFLEGFCFFFYWRADLINSRYQRKKEKQKLFLKWWWIVFVGAEPTTAELSGRRYNLPITSLPSIFSFPWISLLFIYFFCSCFQCQTLKLRQAVGLALLSTQSFPSKTSFYRPSYFSTSGGSILCVCVQGGAGKNDQLSDWEREKRGDFFSFLFFNSNYTVFS